MERKRLGERGKSRDASSLISESREEGKKEGWLTIKLFTRGREKGGRKEDEKN